MPATGANKRKVPAAGKDQTPSKKLKTDLPTQKYYAVRTGARPGVYLTWDECQRQTAGVRGAQYKSFPNRKDAEAFVAGKNPKKATDGSEPDKFYAVAVGTVTGIFTDWDTTAKSIKGSKGPKFKKFATREEAVEFIKEFGSTKTIAALGEEGLSKAGSGSKKKTRVARADVPFDEDEESMLKVYTDGSSRRNGRAGATAGVGVYFGPSDPRNISERLAGEPQTNQRAELTAILRALGAVDADEDVMILTDSMYSINCAVVWPKSWDKRKDGKWTSSTGDDVKNQDLVKGILAALAKREEKGSRTVFKWVKGHSDNQGNIGADLLAVRGAML